jgi:hypothetical protein
MNHPLIVQIENTGDLTLVFHPDKQVGEADVLSAELGTVTDDRRGGHVVPRDPWRRIAFRTLRWLFGGRGKVADWTRRWRCWWIVIDAATGKPLPCMYANHAVAVDVEVRWILSGMNRQ